MADQEKTDQAAAENAIAEEAKKEAHLKAPADAVETEINAPDTHRALLTEDNAKA